MRICFFASEKPRERELAAAFISGLGWHGDAGVVRALDGGPQVARGFDAVAMVGVKSADLFAANRAAGIHTIMLDKGYLRDRIEGTRKWKYWRVAVNAHHPTRYLMTTRRPHDRLARLRLEVAPWRTKGDHILIAGSSAKYHAFYGLPEPTGYAKALVAEIRKLTDRPLIYRPKPSWKEATEIAGTTYSPPKQRLEEVLAGARAVVTHGSNACFEAVLAGVPCVVLGEAVAMPISSTTLGAIEKPRKATKNQRLQWLANLAYQQWTLDEFGSGAAWSVIRDELR